MILLYPDDRGHLHTVLIQRPGYQGVHSAQVAFPGGKREKEDPDLKATAMREAEEEVGVASDRSHLLGELTEILIPPSGYIVTPHVAYVAKRPSLIPEPSEVDTIYEVPVRHFIGQEAIEQRRVRAGSDGVILKVPAFIWEGSVIWGATAMMLSELSMILEEELSF